MSFARTFCEYIRWCYLFSCVDDMPLSDKECQRMDEEVEEEKEKEGGRKKEEEEEEKKKKAKKKWKNAFVFHLCL